jgi:hypothetical protein
MFRRHIRKSLAQDVPPILQEANFVFDKGEYGRAGELFEQIAQTAAARGGRRASLFYLQAGRARVLAGQISLGMPSLKRAFELLIEQKRPLRLQRIARRVILELKERGLEREAAEVESWLNNASPFAPAKDAPTKRPVLSTHCPSCGAAVRPDEIEWLDDITAECAYCGSPLRAEG